jgi:hypothetical protein
MSQLAAWGLPAPPSSPPFVATGTATATTGRVIPFRRPIPGSEQTPTLADEDRLRALHALDRALIEAEAISATVPHEQATPSELAQVEAIALLEMMHSNVATPRVAIEPDGSISFSWERDDNWLVLAVEGRGMIDRSAVIHGAEEWGSTELSGRFAPEEVALLAQFTVPWAHA